MQHSNRKQDRTHPKVDTLSNVESPGINCIHNLSGFLLCVLIYLYIHASLGFWCEKFSVVCLQRSFSKQRSCHTAIQQIWLQRGHQLKGHHQGPTSTVGGQEMRKKNLLSRRDWVINGVISHPHFSALEMFFSTALFSRKPACTNR